MLHYYNTLSKVIVNPSEYYKNIKQVIEIMMRKKYVDNYWRCRFMNIYFVTIKLFNIILSVYFIHHPIYYDKIKKNNKKMQY